VKLHQTVGISVAVLAGIACGDGNSTTSSTAYVGPATLATGYDAAMTYAVTDPLANPYYLALQVGAAATTTTTTTMTPDEAASAAATAADHYFTPGSCVKATAKGSQVTYQLSSCRGPFGVSKMNGTLNVRFSSASVSVDAGSDAGAGEPGLAFMLSSSDLVINGDASMISSHGTYRRSASGAKEVMLTSTSTLTHNGRQIMNAVNTTISWMAGSQCIDVNSTGEVTSGTQTSGLRITDYKRCAGKCPASGTVRLSDSQTVTLMLDGSNMPGYKTSDGNIGTVTLDCGS
jgi:hypothetical protein